MFYVFTSPFIISFPFFPSPFIQSIIFSLNRLEIVQEVTGFNRLETTVIRYLLTQNSLAPW